MSANTPQYQTVQYLEFYTSQIIFDSTMSVGNSCYWEIKISVFCLKSPWHDRLGH